MAQFAFTSVSNQTSAFVPLRILDLDARQPNGTPVSEPTVHAGRVVVIAEQPLVEAFLGTNDQRTIILYGTAGRNYILECATNLVDPVWTFCGQDTLTNQLRRFDAGVTNQTLFYRAREQ
jgi:hypothetical protein